MGNTFQTPWTNRRSWISNKRPAAERVRFRYGVRFRRGPWGPLRPCGGGGGGAKRPQSRGLWPLLWFGRPGAEGPRPPNAAAPPGRPEYPSPRVQRTGMGGAAQPIPAPSPWACRVPLRLAAAAAAPRFRQGCGNRCGPAGGRRGRKAPTKPGPLAPALVWQAGGPKAPGRQTPPPPRRASYRQQKPGQTKKASEPRPLLLLLMHQIRPQCGEIGD